MWTPLAWSALLAALLILSRVSSVKSDAARTTRVLIGLEAPWDWLCAQTAAIIPPDSMSIMKSLRSRSRNHSTAVLVVDSSVAEARWGVWMAIDSTGK